jgi:pyridoxamine 5'-phosphate oxidase
VDVTDLDADPLRQLATWLHAARAAGQPMPEAMTIASATSDAIPSARLVVLRGLQRGLVFFTDCESDKGAELAANHGRLPCCTGLFRLTARYARPGRLSG